MKKNKILTIFGTRPEAVKLAPVIKKLEEHSETFDSVVCVTAQHRQMLDQVLQLFTIAPHHDLNIMQPNQSLFDVTSRALLGIQKVLEAEKPDFVFVQGDTTTAFVAGLAAYYLRIPVGHVEAGLRTNDKYQPFPEEINRRLVTHIAEEHFAPTAWARENLLKEGVADEKITVTGNTVIDALLMVVNGQSQPAAVEKWNGFFREQIHVPLDSRRIVLITGHRRESFGEGFLNICMALRQIAERNEDAMLIYPVHLNPNVQKPVREILGSIPNIHLIDPLDYAPFVFLMSRAYVILTDSGGVQEEAPSLGKPVLVMRNVTERPEAISAGTAKLVGTDVGAIVGETQRFFTDEAYYRQVSQIRNPYGDGKASERIIATLHKVFA